MDYKENTFLLVIQYFLHIFEPIVMYYVLYIYLSQLLHVLQFKSKHRRIGGVLIRSGLQIRTTLPVRFINYSA